MSSARGPGGRLGVSAVGVVVSLAMVGAACSASGERPDDARATETQPVSEPPPTGRLQAGEPCPVTRGVDPRTVPAILNPGADDVGWYGEDDLWVLLASARALGKFPIITMEDGEFTDEYGRPDVHATRLDGPGRAHVGFGGYATEVTDGQREPLQWWPTSVGVSARGCWLVTIEFRDSTVHIVLAVKRPLDARGQRPR